MAEQLLDIITNLKIFNEGARHYVDTISRWMKTVMIAAGIDCSAFKPHSVRSASVSKACSKVCLPPARLHFQVYPQADGVAFFFQQITSDQLSKPERPTDRPLHRLVKYVEDTWINSTVWSVESWTAFSQPTRNNPALGILERAEPLHEREGFYRYEVISATLEAKGISLAGVSADAFEDLKPTEIHLLLVHRAKAEACDLLVRLKSTNWLAIRVMKDGIFIIDSRQTHPCPLSIEDAAHFLKCHSRHHGAVDIKNYSRSKHLFRF
ncbi:unnamed protein product [Mytilus edulis]|uniref:ubiquitinyl hydrolase 1 n=1 Tax=Mytilus edulis TaxID=6550 RepID=A0A8S3T6E6_MYTED|nr:unnamed protein product [Mytilus edulis]